MACRVSSYALSRYFFVAVSTISLAICLGCASFWDVSQALHSPMWELTGWTVFMLALCFLSCCFLCTLCSLVLLALVLALHFLSCYFLCTLLTCFIGSRACFALSVLLLSVQSLLACFWRSFSGLGHSHAFRGLVRQTIFCFSLTLEHMLATFTQFQL